jgi:hypothetical protein
MFPDPKNLPSERYQFGVSAAISFDVTIQLLPPPVAVGPWRQAVQWAAVPETPVNHHSQSYAAEHNVGSAAVSTKQ